jgi:DNA repair exonuclease SbcCD ATPase subunit
LRRARDAAAEGAGAGTDTDEAEALRAQVADLEGKVARLRAERAEAYAERDEARDIAEELQAASGMSPDDRAMALRAEVEELRIINQRLTKNIDRLRGEKASDPKVLNKALVVELDALKAIRASEAAELSRILSDLEQGETGEGGHA